MCVPACVSSQWQIDLVRALVIPDPLDRPSAVHIWMILEMYSNPAVRSDKLVEIYQRHVNPKPGQPSLDHLFDIEHAKYQIFLQDRTTTTDHPPTVHPSEASGGCFLSLCLMKVTFIVTSVAAGWMVIFQ